MRSMIAALAVALFGLTFAAAPAFAGEACCPSKKGATCDVKKDCKCADCKKECNGKCECGKPAPEKK